MKGSKFLKEFKKQTAIAIVAAFGFLIALAWRDFISEVVTKIVESLGVETSLYLYKLLAAVIITIIAIIGIILASKLNSEEKKD
ncbi:MAG: DUF5654 family protein [Candidatus Pacearchaeota archaeon]